jgi:L,D-peptidoglycan transpeptidase YkuD (ErfK/YbiS/YcfS/YnhG family)
VTTASLAADGWLHFGGRLFRAALGAAGLAAHKQEGDHATPLGLLPLRRVLYRVDRLAPPRCAVPVEPIGRDDGWCDDPTHADYNRIIRTAPLAHPPRHEALWRGDDIYDVIGVLGWNDAPPVPYRGSAIFLHLARPDYAPTEGCVALARADLLSVLAAGLTAIEAG